MLFKTFSTKWIIFPMVANPTIGFFLNAYIFLELFILPSNTIYNSCIAFTIVSTEKAGTLLYFKILILCPPSHSDPALSILSSNFAHTTTFEPVLLFRLLSLLPKVKTDGSLAERKQKVRFDSVSLHSHFTICFLTAQPLFPPWFLYFPYFLY